MNRRIYLFCFLALFSCADKNKDTHYIARVGKATLSQNELKNMLFESNSQRQFDQNYIHSLITSWMKKEILYQKAKQYHFEKDPAIQSKVDNFFRDLTIDTFIKYYVQTNVAISENEIKEFYNSNKKSYTRNTDEARVSHIILSDLNDARHVKTILNSRNVKDREILFATYAFETKIIRRGEAIDQIDNTVFETPPRTVLAPIPSDYGYHVVEVLDRFPKGSIRPLVEVRDEIIQILTQRKIQDSYNILVDSLLSTADVDINENNILKFTSVINE